MEKNYLKENFENKMNGSGKMDRDRDTLKEEVNIKVESFGTSDTTEELDPTYMLESPFTYSERRKYGQSTIIKDGILEKWTNFLCAWKDRYFIIEPGILKYAETPGEHIKETYPLASCHTRFSSKNPLCLELRHGTGVMYLRMPTVPEKKQWMQALLEAKHAFQIPCHPPFYSIENKQAESKNNIYQDTTEFKEENKALVTVYEGKSQEENKTPMQLLLEHMSNCFKCFESLTCELQRTQTTFVHLFKNLQDSTQQEAKKVALQQLVETINHLYLVMKRFLIVTETLAVDEDNQRKSLENLINILARDHYMMSLKLTRIHKHLLRISNLPEAILATQEHLNELHRILSKYSQLTLEPKKEEEEDTQCNAFVTQLIEQEPIWKNHILHMLQSFQVLQKILQELQDQPSSELNENDDPREFFDVDEDLSSNTYDTPSNEIIESSSFMNTETENSCVLTTFARRNKLPAQRKEFNTISLWKIVKDFTGRDWYRMSLPIYFNEPLSFLQRIAEDFHYSYLLCKASEAPTSLEALTWITAFSATPNTSTLGRTFKPFNPLLGETFELSHRGFRFISEQVVHHPPITAYSLESDCFDAYGDLMIKTRFTGKRIEISLFGPSHIILKHKSTQLAEHHYTLQRCKAYVNNVIFGKLSLQMWGSVVLTNHTTGECCFMEYVPGKWWTKVDQCEIRAIIYDAKGVPQYKLGGHWNNQIWSEKLLDSIDSCLCIPPAKKTIFNNTLSRNTQRGIQESFYITRDIKEFKVNWDAFQCVKNSKKILWKYLPNGLEAEKYYQFTQYTMELNEITPEYDPKLGASIPLTDSRFRMDQRYLEEGKIEEAIKEKERLEVNQRLRASNEDPNETGIAQWFKKEYDPYTEQSCWMFTGDYWTCKKNKCFSSTPTIFS